MSSEPSSTDSLSEMNTKAAYFALLIEISKDNSWWKHYMKDNRDSTRKFLVAYTEEDFDRINQFTNNMKMIMRKEWVESKMKQEQSKSARIHGSAQLLGKHGAKNTGETVVWPKMERAARKTVPPEPENVEIDARPTVSRISLYTDTPLPSDRYGDRGRAGDDMKLQAGRTRMVAGLQYDESTTHYVWKLSGIKLSYEALSAAKAVLPSADSVSLVPECFQCIYHYDTDINNGYPPHMATQCGGAVFWSNDGHVECCCCREKGILCEFSDLYESEVKYLRGIESDTETTSDQQEIPSIFSDELNPFTKKRRTVDKAAVAYHITNEMKRMKEVITDIEESDRDVKMDDIWDLVRSISAKSKEATNSRGRALHHRRIYHNDVVRLQDEYQTTIRADVVELEKKLYFDNGALQFFPPIRRFVGIAQSFHSSLASATRMSKPVSALSHRWLMGLIGRDSLRKTTFSDKNGEYGFDYLI
ncbi:hypothetical protein CALCODRAFT_509948 [Calocera cornea HHB12733]|uniref:Uncharacterized protein n=1 Tax=Calocera cornea HHB12733 TaxID=1353952 RepID=A0A165EWW1_9BASI|nr:hypothetical protein CALCODRAFT_509948 [Calocera cornea HHB12733]